MSFLIHDGTYIVKSGFKSEKEAKTSLTRRWKRKHPNAKVCSTDYFHQHIDHMITVKSLGNGNECQIRASEKGGCCDPSTELYWSM